MSPLTWNLPSVPEHRCRAAVCPHPCIAGCNDVTLVVQSRVDGHAVQRSDFNPLVRGLDSARRPDFGIKVCVRLH